MRDSLEVLGGTARWVPHEKNVSDCMTKVKGNVVPLLKLMREAKYKLVAENEEMQYRKEYREEMGKANPRPNLSTETTLKKIKANPATWRESGLNSTFFPSC